MSLCVDVHVYGGRTGVCGGVGACVLWEPVCICVVCTGGLRDTTGIVSQFGYLEPAPQTTDKSKVTRESVLKAPRSARAEGWA